MAVEQDLVRVLNKLEKYLANSSNMSSGNNKGKMAGGGNPSNDKQDDTKRFKAVAKSLDQLEETTNKLDKSFIGLNKTLLLTRSSFVALNKNVRSASKAKGIAPSAPEQNTTNAPSVPKQNTTNAPLPNSKVLNATLGSMSIATSKATSNVALFATRLAPIPVLLTALGQVLDTLVNDTFRLLSRGVGASSLGTLYFDAARAGMGLQEYTDMLASSMPAVSRFKDLDSFGNTVNTVNKDLANLGIFGKNAAELSSTMVTTGATLGVSQAQLESGAKSQVKVFESLRASTMMTADEFKALSEEIGQTQEVQSLMLGLDQAERGQRINDIAKMKTFGLTLGASAAASKALGDALIQQRNLTAQQRFQSAGTIRQAAAITGMGAGEAEELAKLSRKKNLTSEDAVRVQALGGKLQAQLETMMNSGNIQEEYMAEQLQARLDEAGIGNLIKKAGDVELSKQTGPVINADLGKAANSLEKAAGELMTAAQGLAKNPIATGVATVVGALLVGFLGKKLLGSVKSLLPSSPSKSGTPSINAPNVPNAPNVTTGSKKMGGSAIGKALGSSQNIMSPITDKVFDLLPNMFKNGVKSIPIVGMLAGFLIDGVGEAITGNVNSAFDPNNENGPLSKVGNAIYAGVTGMFGGVADLIDGVIGMFTDDGLNLRNSFDKFAAGMRSGFFNMLASIIEVLPFGKDSDIAKSMRSSAEAANKVYNELSADSTSTVASIGAKNQELKKAQKESTTAVTAIGNNMNKIVHSTVGLAEGALQDAARITATPGPSQAKVQITPVVPEQQTATEQAVNKARNVAATQAANITAAKEAAASISATEGSTPTNQQLTDMITLLTTANELAVAQNEILTNLVRGVKVTSSPDASTLLSRLSAQL